MSHHRYQTEALVIGGRDWREASCGLFLLTPEQGLILVLAQGLRAPRAKLRGFLQPFSHATVELVRGREYWRVIGAGNGRFNYYSFSDQSRRLLGRVFALLRRLLPAEGPPEKLFAELMSVNLFLSRQSIAADPDFNWTNFELVLVARLLHHLGYLPETPLLRRHVLELTTPNDFCRLPSRSAAEAILATVNDSLAHSHL